MAGEELKLTAVWGRSDRSGRAGLLPDEWRKVRVGDTAKVSQSVGRRAVFSLFDIIDVFRGSDPDLGGYVEYGSMNTEGTAF